MGWLLSLGGRFTHTLVVCLWCATFHSELVFSRSVRVGGIVQTSVLEEK